MKTKPTMTNYLDFAFCDELHSESETTGTLAAGTVASILDIVSQPAGTELAEAIEFAIEELVEQIAPSPGLMVIVRRNGLRVVQGAKRPVVEVPEAKAA